MRPLNATCWAVVWRRTTRSNAVRSISLKLNGSGFGPRMIGSPAFPGFRPSILQADFRLNVLEIGVEDQNRDRSGYGPENRVRVDEDDEQERAHKRHPDRLCARREEEHYR
jgi:hypothetical protein